MNCRRRGKAAEVFFFGRIASSADLLFFVCLFCFFLYGFGVFLYGFRVWYGFEAVLI